MDVLKILRRTLEGVRFPGGFSVRAKKPLTHVVINADDAIVLPIKMLDCLGADQSAASCDKYCFHILRTGSDSLLNFCTLRTRLARRPASYQILQAFSRTIGSPFLHPNALANSSMSERGPFTLNFETGCGLLLAISRAYSGRRLAPHTCAQPRKNRCSGVKPSRVGGRLLSICFS